MKKEVIYPKNINDLLTKINYIINNDENTDRVNNMTKWLEWFENLNIKLEIKLKSNEYLRAYYNNNNCSLQVWNHGKLVDSAAYDLVSNYYGKYYSQNTIIVEI